MLAEIGGILFFKVAFGWLSGAVCSLLSALSSALSSALNSVWIGAIDSFNAACCKAWFASSMCAWLAEIDDAFCKTSLAWLTSRASSQGNGLGAVNSVFFSANATLPIVWVWGCDWLFGAVFEAEFVAELASAGGNDFLLPRAPLNISNAAFAWLDLTVPVWVCAETTDWATWLVAAWWGKASLIGATFLGAITVAETGNDALEACAGRCKAAVTCARFALPDFWALPDNNEGVFSTTGLNANMRNNVMLKPAYSSGAKPNSLRPCTAIW